MRIKNKITAVFLGMAMIGLVAGFCDALISSASASMDSSMMGYEAPNGQMHFSPSAVLIHAQNKIPLDNSLKPCCTTKSSGIPSTQATNFEAGIKLLPLTVEVVSPDLQIYFENKLNTSSDSSPPKPDKISSILRLE